MSQDDSRALLEAAGLPWPVLDAETRAELGNVRLSRVTDLVRQPQNETLHYLPPHYPDRTVPDEVSEDDDTGEQIVLTWRTLSDEEWAERFAAYEKARAEWTRCGGMIVRKVGPDIVTATFIAENGTRVEMRWCGEWIVIGWSTP